jgi:hypothetical protein
MSPGDHVGWQFPGNQLRWLIHPQQQAELVKAYQATERLLKCEKDARVLQYAAMSYARMLANYKLFDQAQGDVLVANIQNVCHYGALRAALHRFNCELVRVLSGNTPCPHPCCCRCQAGYRNIVCNGWLTADHPSQGPAN